MNTSTKRCKKCQMDFPATSQYFYTTPRTKDGLRGKCKKCFLEDSSTYNKSHRDIINARAREKWPETYKRKAEKHKKHSRDWYHENKARGKSTRKRWYLDNQETVRAIRHRYKARKRSLPNTLTSQEWERCLSYFNHSCVYCGHQRGLFPTTQLSAEHFIPLSYPNSPGTVVENILPACVLCNSTKQDIEPIEWLNRQFGKRKAKQILAQIEAYFEWVKSQAPGDENNDHEDGH